MKYVTTTRMIIQLFCYSIIHLLFLSCSNDMDIINRLIDIEIDPDLVAENVEVLYSDSARLQMKMETPVVKQFNSATEQRDEYPQGLHVWFYERTGELKGQIRANWAIHDKIKDLWEARSDVVAINSEGQKLETEQLFWDPQKGIVYSDKYTKITTEEGNIATGDRFTAKQNFSEWKLFQGRATIMLRDEEPDENETDTIMLIVEELNEDETANILSDKEPDENDRTTLKLSDEETDEE